MKSAVRFLLLIGMASPACADLTAKYVSPGSGIVLTLEVASNGDARGDSGQPGQSFLARDGHGYFLTATPAQTAVMRIEDVGAAMDEQMANLDPQFLADMQQRTLVIQVVEKGVMTINGRKGTAYYLQDSDGSLSPKPWAVIDKDPTLAPLGSAMLHQFEMSMATMSARMGTAPFANMLAVLKTGTPILFAGLELRSVDRAPVPASRFDLPSKPASLDEVRRSLSPGSPKP